MAFNPIAYGIDELLVSATTGITLGFGPGQTPPPRLLLIYPTSTTFTIALPPTRTVLPTPPGTPNPVVGVSGGFVMSIKNLTTYTPTVTAYTATGANGFTDTVADTLTLNAVNAQVQLEADPNNNTWYRNA